MSNFWELINQRATKWLATGAILLLIAVGSAGALPLLKPIWDWPRMLYAWLGLSIVWAVLCYGVLPMSRFGPPSLPEKEKDEGVQLTKLHTLKLFSTGGEVDTKTLPTLAKPELKRIKPLLDLDFGKGG
jgi:hypothetical protein